MRTKSTGGFTLIELLIVIAIIGILAAVLIPNLLSARTRAFDTAAQSCARSIATAQEVFAIDSATNAYAENYAALVAHDNNATGTLQGCEANEIVVVGTTAWMPATPGNRTPWTVRHTNGRTLYSVDSTGITDAPYVAGGG